MNKRSLGTAWEEQAAEFLKREGCEILERNFRGKRGEIDLIARDGRYLVFVEVKYRKTAGSGLPEEAVNYRKQQTISRVALEYLLKQRLPETMPCRFDVVAICGNRIRHIRNAFDSMAGWY